MNVYFFAHMCLCLCREPFPPFLTFCSIPFMKGWHDPSSFPSTLLVFFFCTLIPLMIFKGKQRLLLASLLPPTADENLLNQSWDEEGGEGEKDHLLPLSSLLLLLLLLPLAVSTSLPDLSSRRTSVRSSI